MIRVRAVLTKRDVRNEEVVQTNFIGSPKSLDVAAKIIRME